jgi:hypothetical protein
MDQTPTPQGQDPQAQRDAQSQAEFQKRLNDPEEFKKLVAALHAREDYDRAEAARRRECADRLNRYHYYAEVAEYAGNPDHRQWADCRLYANPAVPPDRQDTRGCIGTVWLHNPSTAFRVTLPHAWGRIDLNQPEDPRANTINYTIHILQKAIAGAQAKGYSPPAQLNYHFNLEELVYLDSDSITGLWWKLPTAELEPFSHRARFRDKPAFPLSPAFKFIWIAWGDLPSCCFRDHLFTPLVKHAAQAASIGNVDLVFVQLRRSLKPPYYSLPIHRWSCKNKQWLTYLHHPGQKQVESLHSI